MSWEIYIFLHKVLEEIYQLKNDKLIIKASGKWMSDVYSEIYLQR